MMLFSLVHANDEDSTKEEKLRNSGSTLWGCFPPSLGGTVLEKKGFSTLVLSPPPYWQDLYILESVLVCMLSSVGINP